LDDTSKTTLFTSLGQAYLIVTFLLQQTVMMLSSFSDGHYFLQRHEMEYSAIRQRQTSVPSSRCTHAHTTRLRITTALLL